MFTPALYDPATVRILDREHRARLTRLWGRGAQRGALPPGPARPRARQAAPTGTDRPRR